MATLVCGSFAYDNIMVFRDHFKNHVLQDKKHLFSVAFETPSGPLGFGGSGGNLIYGMKLLGLDGMPMATVGHDFDSYSKWFTKHGIAHPYIHVIPEERTAHVTMISDLDGNQISAVQSGAMNRAHLNSIHDAENVTLGVVAPDGIEGMILHSQEFKAAGIPFLFDPGKQLQAFTDIQVTQMVHQATYIVVNDYEWEMLHNATGMREADILKIIKALIITRGSEGAVILTKNEKFDIPAAKPRDWLDPIGCGDAFRAGIVYGLEKGLDWESTGRIATLMGAIKLEHVGTQNYTFTMDEFAHRFYQSFGFKIDF